MELNMAAPGDIYRIQFTYLHENGQECLDTYFYQIVTPGSTGAEDIYGVLLSDLVTDNLDLLNEDNSFTYGLCMNGMDNDDFFEDTTEQVGTRTGASLPSSGCPIFRSSRDRPGDRYSWHRPPFGSVSDLGAVGVWAGAFQTELGTYADLLDNAIPLVAGGSAIPCQITGGFKFGTAPTFKRALTGAWAYGTQMHWLDSREPEFGYNT